MKKRNRKKIATNLSFCPVPWRRQLAHVPANPRRWPRVVTRYAAPASSPEPTRTPPSSVSSPFLREDISLAGTSWPSSLVLALTPTPPHSAPPPMPTSSRHMPAQLHLALALSFSDPDAAVARPISLSPGGNLAGQHELAFFSSSGSAPTPLHASPRARVVEAHARPTPPRLGTLPLDPIRS
jgi:hypothetical protein